MPTPEQVLRGVLCKAKEKETEVLLKELDNVRSFNFEVVVVVIVVCKELIIIYNFRSKTRISY